MQCIRPGCGHDKTRHVRISTGKLACIEQGCTCGDLLTTDEPVEHTRTSTAAPDTNDGFTSYMSIDGCRVGIELKHTADGPVLQLHGITCDLEGQEPGRYLLVPLGSV